MSTARFVVAGRVQAVGFRWFVRKRALALGLRGWVRNLADGRVETVAEGDPAALDQLEATLRDGPEAAVVASVTREPAPAVAEPGFEIR